MGCVGDVIPTGCLYRPAHARHAFRSVRQGVDDWKMTEFARDGGEMRNRLLGGRGQKSCE